MITGKFSKGEGTNPVVLWFQFGGIFVARKLALCFQLNIVLLLTPYSSVFICALHCIQMEITYPHNILKTACEAIEEEKAWINVRYCYYWRCVCAWSAGWIVETFIPLVFVLILVNFCPNCVALQTSRIKEVKDQHFFSPAMSTVEIITWKNFSGGSQHLAALLKLNHPVG